MAQLPTDMRLKLEKAIEDGEIIQKPRPYLGISQIAEPCPRKLWYVFRICAIRTVTKRVQRLLERGNQEEIIIQKDLSEAGVICHSSQKEAITGHGHIKGHIDDLLDNIPDAPKTTHLGEYKTHNEKSFKDLKAKGVAKSKPIHYGQMICYMYLLKLKRGLYIGTNKNTDDRHYERISSNNEKAKELIDRGIDIISTEKPPAKIGNSTWYACKWCEYYDICHFGGTPLKNCRTCKYSDIHNDGIWKCSGHKITLTFEQQLIGCDRHQFLKTLTKKG